MFSVVALNAAAQLTTFTTPSNSPVDYTVPAGCTSVIVSMNGGRGGTGAGAGGAGGRVVCSLAVTPGQILKVYVGGQGGTTGGGVGGSRGGNGGAGGLLSSDGGGGGGSSDIRVGGTALTNRVIVAAGGGGGSSSAGAVGGGLTGGSASGGGGTQSAGGAAGNASATAGTQTSGGNGRAGNLTNDGGGGGGGGYWGGGGGNRSAAGGGGGSNYVGGAGVSGVTTNSQGVSTGNGVVSICARPVAGTITGTPTSICKNATTTFSNTTATSTATKTWSSSNTGVATVNSTTGVVTGVAAGTANITCSVANACETVTTFRTVTVLADPNAISGNAGLCPSSTTTLTNSSGAGTWSSSNTAVASISSGGVVSSTATPGTTTITFTLNSTGCTITRIQTVYALPAVIGGTLAACKGGGTTLTNATSGGTWASLDGSIATVAPTSGTSTTVTGVSAGIVNVKYTSSTGCIRTTTVSILPTPLPVITPNTVDVCMGSGQVFTATATVPDLVLAGQNFNSGIGTWSLNTLSGPVASSFTIITSPNAAGGAGDGSNMLQANAFGNPVATTLTSPSFSTMNLPGVRVKFNMQLLSAPPDATVAVEYSLNSSPTWTPIATPVLLHQVVGDGNWSAAAPEYSATLPPAALNQQDVRVRWNYNGTYFWAIDNISIIVDMPSPTFAWTGPASLSCNNCATPTITPTALGANVYSVIASSGSCISTAAATTTVSVNPLPAAITGFTNPCVGTTTTLNTTSTGGTWAISDPTIASLNASTGQLTGLLQGTATVSYTLPTGCRTATVVTIEAAPAAISGTQKVCEGFSTALSHAVNGGAWVSGATSIATINTTGTVSGLDVGNAPITYTLPSGCTVFATVTVNEQPTALTGADVVCELANTTLASTPAGGTWSTSDAARATVAGGVVTGVNDGTVNISYTLPAGCFVTKTMTVLATPEVITGTMQVCEGLTTDLNSATNGGDWGTSSTTIALVDGSGIVTGVNDGTVTISYTMPNTCYTTATVTVNPLPVAIGGVSKVCVNSTIQLTNDDADGTWSSSVPGVADVAPDGVVTGMAAGNASITYTLSTGCIITHDMTVNPLPANITGLAKVCKGLTTQLANNTLDGTWSTSAPLTATVSGTGLVTGQDAGNATISYILTATGCYATVPATVNPLPADITGTAEVCENGTTQLADADAGGTWSSSAAAIATVGTNGMVSGVAHGNANITYTLPTTCITVREVTVNPLPAAITGTNNVCVASDITLANITADGSWTSSNDGIATIGSGTGIVTGVADGGVTMSYILSTGCYTTKSIIVNPLPADITGDTRICKGLTSLLENATMNGSWSSNTTAIATINTGGMLSGVSDGTAVISYKLSTGCYKVTEVTVDPLPADITGVKKVCEGLTTTLASITPDGTWESSSTVKADVDANGVVSGMESGNAMITYTLPTGCITTATVTVNPSPGMLTGDAAVCALNTTVLGNMVAGGTWTGGAAGIASISATGTVTAIAAGNANVTYTLPAGCQRVDEVTVNPLPDNITTDGNVCVGSTETLTNVTPDGTWASSNTAIADINNTTGDVTGIFAGTANITYKLTTTGCIRTRAITIDPLPATIFGNSAVCEAATTPLFSAPAGAWTSSNTAVATISATGIVSGVHEGLTNITYTLPTGCYVTTPMIVDPLPPAITGDLFACAGATSEVFNTMLGGTWSNATDVAMVNAAGIVTGIAAGTTRISYKMSTGCGVMAVFTVNPLPAPIAGSPSVCEGAVAMATSATLGGSWSTADASMLTIDPSTGVMTGVADGTGAIIYTLPTGCSRTRNITIYEALPAITGDNAVCRGAGTTLANAAPGGVWSSNNAAVAAVGSATGTITGMATGSATIVYALPATGCRATYNIIVNPLPAAIAPASVCAGATTTLSSASAGGTWASADDAIATIEAATGIATGVAAGGVEMTYTLPTGCKATAIVAVYAQPVAQVLAGGGDYCEGSAGAEMTLMGSEVAATYRLYRGPLVVGMATGAGGAVNFGHFTTPGTYSVNATTLSGCAGDMTGAEVVNIVATVTPTISMVADIADTICAGTTGNFTAIGINGGTAPEYKWLINGTEVGTATTYSYVPVNGDEIKAVLVSNAQCATTTMVSALRTINVMPNLTPAISLEVLPGDTLCEGDGAMFRATIANGGDAPMYTWIVDGSVVSSATGATYAYVPSNGDIVVCKLNSSYRCPTANDMSSNVISMKVFDLHIPVVTVVAQPGLTINEGQLATFTATAFDGGTAPTYQWQINDVDVPGANTPVFATRELEDGDVVKCNVQANGLCGKVSFNSVTMKVLEGVSVDPVITAAFDIRLAPNPNSGTFTVSGSVPRNGSKVTLQVTDMLGQVVYTGAAQPKGDVLNETLNLDNSLANGMYLLHLSTGTESRTFHFMLSR
ncbi:hypothetical protein GCM10023093_24000 [Nemorincola caseinilytica]|uniref:receptor protein-tyrosine kinase n=2 Tax=Nemorincola caseinilytica TaxID=2054315 RepID=A0ABP8NIV8_9BACT